jgi:hypothetical protein
LFSFTPSERRSFFLAAFPFSAYMAYALLGAFQNGVGFSSSLGWIAVWLGVAAYWFVRFSPRRRHDFHRTLLLPAWTTLPAISTLTPPVATRPTFTSDTPSPWPTTFRLKPAPLRGPPVSVR